MAALQIIVTMGAFDIHFYDWQQLPFACTYIPGRKSMIGLAGGWIAIFTAVVPVTTILIATASPLTEIWAVFGAFILGIAIWLRIRRREGWCEGQLQYEDLSDGIPDLGIRDMRHVSWPDHSVNHGVK